MLPPFQCIPAGGGGFSLSNSLTLMALLGNHYHFGWWLLFPWDFLA